MGINYQSTGVGILPSAVGPKGDLWESLGVLMDCTGSEIFGEKLNILGSNTSLQLRKFCFKVLYVVWK